MELTCPPGVQSAAVNVICELARRNPKNYLSLAPLFFKLMTSSTNNWVLIKIIKLVSPVVPGVVLGGVMRGSVDPALLLPLVWCSHPPGAQAGEEADRATHQPHSQVGLGSLPTLLPWTPDLHSPPGPSPKPPYSLPQILCSTPTSLCFPTVLLSGFRDSSMCLPLSSRMVGPS